MQSLAVATIFPSNARIHFSRSHATKCKTERSYTGVLIAYNARTPALRSQLSLCETIEH
jgi:hypothetical protein